MSIKSLKEKFDALSPKAKKAVVVAATSAVGILLFFMLYQAANVAKSNDAESQQQTVETRDFTENDKSVTMKAGYDKKVSNLMKRIEVLEQGKAAAEDSKQNEQMPAVSQTERPPMFNDLKDVPPPSGDVKYAYPQPKNSQTGAENYQPQQPQKPVERVISKIGYMSAAERRDEPEKEASDVKKRKNWIPSNSIFKATLVTGVYAPTLAKGKQSPYPVVLRLRDLSFFPNEFRKDLSGCFIGGEAYGNLSDERVNVRLNNLSCLSEMNEAVIDVPVSGFVQGEDGIIGLAGRVVSKQGQVMAAAFVSSFLQGMGEAFSMANQSITTSALGSTTTTISEKDILKYGAGSGFAESFKMLAKYYTDILNDTSPVIEVLGGRDVEVIINKGVDINPEGWEWNDIK